MDDNTLLKFYGETMEGASLDKCRRCIAKPDSEANSARRSKTVVLIRVVHKVLMMNKGGNTLYGKWKTYTL